MPKRLLDDGLLTSPSIAACSPGAQDAFPRFILAADDFGCFFADPRVLKGRAWPLRDDVTPAAIAGWMREYERLGMLQLWAEGDRVFGYLTGWDGEKGQRKREEYSETNKKGSRRKTPPPPREMAKYPELLPAEFPPNPAREKQLPAPAVPVVDAVAVVVPKGAGAVAPRASAEEFALEMPKPLQRGRHAVLQERLLATYERVTGEKYEHAGGKDAKAIARLAKSERTDDAIDALWSFSVATAPAYPFTRSLAQFVSKLGDIVAAVSARDPWRGEREVGRTREERGDCAVCGPSLQVFDGWGCKLCVICMGAWMADKVEPNEAATAAWVQERRKEIAA